MGWWEEEEEEGEEKGGSNGVVSSISFLLALITFLLMKIVKSLKFGGELVSNLGINKDNQVDHMPHIYIM